MGYARSAMAITCRLYKGGVLKEEAFDPARVSDLIQEEGARVWLDVEDPTDDELTLVAEEFDLHPVSVEDTRHQGQRPKVEFFERYFLIVLHGLSLDDQNELVDSEIHAFAGHQYLLTLRYAPAFDLAPVLKRWDRRPDHTSRLLNTGPSCNDSKASNTATILRVLESSLTLARLSNKRIKSSLRALFCRLSTTEFPIARTAFVGSLVNHFSAKVMSNRTRSEPVASPILRAQPSRSSHCASSKVLNALFSLPAR